MSYCSKCGASNEDGAVFCAACGEPIGISVPPAEENDKTALLTAFSGTHFLAICILITIATVMSFGIVQLLFAVFCWMIYSNAKSGQLNVPMLRNVSGTVFAGKVIFIVCSVLLFFCAGIIYLCALVIPPEIAGEFSQMYDQIMEIFRQEGLPELWNKLFAGLLSSGIKSFFKAMAGTIAGLAAYMLCQGILFGGAHKTAKELYSKAEVGDMRLESAGKGIACMMIAGVVTGVFALLESSISFTSVIPSLCNAAALIIGALFIKKYFKD